MFMWALRAIISIRSSLSLSEFRNWGFGSGRNSGYMKRNSRGAVFFLSSALSSFLLRCSAGRDDSFLDSFDTGIIVDFGLGMTI